MNLFRRLRPVAHMSAAALAAALTACSSPPAHFYTLTGAGNPSAIPANPPFLIEVPAVSVPEEINRKQLVVHKSATQVEMLEQTRWAAPPADEIRQALSSNLATQLRTIDIAGSPHPAQVPVYRIQVNLQRFESWPGQRTTLSAVWSVRALQTQAVMTCHSRVTESVLTGYDALVAGHRRALDQLAAEIANGVRALAGSAHSASPLCPVALSSPVTADDIDPPVS